MCPASRVGWFTSLKIFLGLLLELGTNIKRYFGSLGVDWYLWYLAEICAKTVKNHKIRMKNCWTFLFIDFLCRYFPDLALKCTIGIYSTIWFLGKIWPWSLVKNTLAGLTVNNPKQELCHRSPVLICICKRFWQANTITLTLSLTTNIYSFCQQFPSKFSSTIIIEK